MAYSVELTPEAFSGLELIDQKNQQRILRKIEWLAENFSELSPTALTGDLSGLFKLRVGDYRVLYSFSESTKVLTVHRIGHRREIYS
ncbi:type II toxin-antitoxin system RelE family toxin [Leptolyngbya sp. AN03gr2]|uniref:type II toxin-antitoxin system RelE family toxin n=1 Tax=unclassified Leptolyngbya TaxID=2650499 RepID=UPI003D317F9B